MPKLTGADEQAIRPMVQCRPVWTGVARAGDVLDADRLLLHAGPPFGRTTDLPAPVRNSLALACVYEGWAADAQAGRAMVE